ncbi:hypothetical protein GCM10011342_13570 [Aquisalinus flavus]|uniref:Uncharacterized protein n=1 Tax=Aquisalinus flavus TaxID=1526572 RepID=A0A8J2Y7T1_9PROT|nr:hypothetical protein GCM10011342_13570 [Aquisalinus flavus]
MGSKLFRIDEDGSNAAISPLLAEANKGKMPIMQGAHGRHQGNGFTSGSPHRDMGAQARYRLRAVGDRIVLYLL